MTIAVDFDGTIVEDKYPQTGTLLNGAKATLQRLHAEGHQIILWTCRTGQPLTDAVNFLLAEQIPFDSVNDCLQKHIDEYGCNTRKVTADVYIDDRNYGCGGIDWEKIYFDFFKERIRQQPFP